MQSLSNKKQIELDQRIEEIISMTSNDISFIIDIPPKPQQRPRFSFKMRKVYVPEAASSKKAIGNILKQQLPKDFNIALSEVSVRIDFFIEIPKSFNKIDYSLAELGYLKPVTNKGDLDNLAKPIMDACTEIIWIDDRQLVECKLTKKYSSNPRTELHVNVLNGFTCPRFRKQMEDKLNKIAGD